jgi:hypothetical protein
VSDDKTGAGLGSGDWHNDAVRIPFKKVVVSIPGVLTLAALARRADRRRTMFVFVSDEFVLGVVISGLED